MLLLLIACGGQSKPEPKDAGNKQSTADLKNGEALFNSETLRCAECHGSNGEGNNEFKAPPLQGCSFCSSEKSLSTYIETFMPSSEPGLCVGSCASDLAAYILSRFNPTPSEFACVHADVKPISLRRLNNLEIANSVDHFFGVGGNTFLEMLPEDKATFNLFPTSAERLDVGVAWTGEYYDAALIVVDEIVAEGKFAPNCEALDCIVDAMAETGELLYRRPLSDAVLGTFANIAKDYLDANFPADKVKSLMLHRLLTAPGFLFVQPEPDFRTGYNYSVKYMTERLSLALTGTLPDKKLLQQMQSLQSNGDQTLTLMIDTIIDSEQFEKFFDAFVKNWLGIDWSFPKPIELELADVDNATWEQLKQDLDRETQLFILHIFRNNLPFTDLLNADYSFLNERLLQHYNLTRENVGEDFVKVQFEIDDERRGLLTQGAVLAAIMGGERTQLGAHGYSLSATFNCLQPPFPPNDFSIVLEPQPANITELVQRRTTEPACSACHLLLDPLAKAMTEFGATGEKYSLDYEDNPLNTSGIYLGESFNNLAGIAPILQQDESFTRCFTKKFLTHSLSKAVLPEKDQADACFVDQAVDNFRANFPNKGARDLIKSLLTSELALKVPRE